MRMNCACIHISEHEYGKFCMVLIHTDTQTHTYGENERTKIEYPLHNVQNGMRSPSKIHLLAQIPHFVCVFASLLSFQMYLSSIVRLLHYY